MLKNNIKFCTFVYRCEKFCKKQGIQTHNRNKPPAGYGYINSRGENPIIVHRDELYNLHIVKKLQLKEIANIYKCRYGEISKLLKKLNIGVVYYNTGDRNPFFNKKHKQETIDDLRQKCREASLGENNAFYGKHHTKETLDKIHKTKELTGRWGKTKKIVTNEQMQRPCPYCGCIIQYKNIKYMRRAQKLNLACLSCTGLKHARRGEENHSYGKTTVHPKPIYYKDLILKSTYELAFVQRLEFLNIKFQYEPKRFKLSNGKTYVPDFYLPEHNKWIEIKGWIKDKDIEKRDLVKKDYNIDIPIINKLKTIQNFTI